jgi:GDPmannose 4,6-dehydratase
MTKKALITGITGQDGHFLAKLLMEKGYDVHGLVRRNSQASLGTLAYMAGREKVRIHWGDLTDEMMVRTVISQGKYDEIFHLGAQSFVGLSFTNPGHTYDVNISGTLNVVNAVKDTSPSTRLYFAATSELYGKVQQTPQTEETPFYPRSPYGVAKLAGFWTIKNYRESYGLFMSNGILFNHESEHRGAEFITRKISLGVAAIAKGKQSHLELGNLEAKRDWGYAPEYVEGMWRILQHKEPDDFVLATNETHSVREFVQEAFKIVDKEISWEGEAENEVGRDRDGKVLVKINPQFYRPAEVELLIGDAAKAKKVLGWTPKVTFKELVGIMVKNDLALTK